MSILLVVILVILILACIPHYPYSANWGYMPSSLLVVLLVVLLVLLLLGRI